jgi:FtsP/CotA-like multicopper oxidase with cupredoxin domain
MRGFALKKTRVLLALVVTAAGVSLASSTASAAALSIDLCAVPGTATMPGPVSVPIWGFVLKGVAANCSDVTGQLPGPVLTVNQGDTVTINVTNALPAATAPLHTVAFEIPGVSFNSGPSTADVGATVARTFTASAPGTYVYQSGGDSGRQEAMGLSGALIVRPTSAPDTPIPGQAYGSASTGYDIEAMLVLGAIDPVFNAAPDTYDIHAYRATYWLINGQPYTPAATGITAATGQRVLLRYVNAGFDNTSMTLLGMHERVLARDARLLSNPLLADAETIPAGATEDAITTVPAGAAPSVHGFPLFNRQLHLTDGPQGGSSPSPATGGGMLTFIHP